MKVTLTAAACTLIREPGDKALSHESTVGFHMKRLLNHAGHSFVRMNPSRHGLTGCTVGLQDHKQGIILWHERYAIEAAHKAFNAGKVAFMRTDTRPW